MPIQGPDIYRLFDLVIEQNASDLHIAVGRPPVVRSAGARCENINHPPLTPPGDVGADRARSARPGR